MSPTVVFVVAICVILIIIMLMYASPYEPFMDADEIPIWDLNRVPTSINRKLFIKWLMDLRNEIELYQDLDEIKNFLNHILPEEIRQVVENEKLDAEITDINQHIDKKENSLDDGSEKDVYDELVEKAKTKRIRDITYIKFALDKILILTCAKKSLPRIDYHQMVQFKRHPQNQMRTDYIKPEPLQGDILSL